MKKELASITNWSSVLTKGLMEIQINYAYENPTYEPFNDKKIQWEIDAKKALIREV